MFLHPSKVIFKYLSFILHTTELECYVKYLDNALDFRLDFQTLSEQVKTDEKLAKNFYGAPSEGVKFFNYLKSADWARLSNGVLPPSECLCFYKKKDTGKNKVVKIYDETVNQYLLSDDESTPLKRHIFLLQFDKKEWVIEFCSGKEECNLLFPSISEELFMLKSTKPCILFSSMINEILQMHFESENYSSSEVLPSKINFNDFTNDINILNHVKYPVLICSHTGSTITAPQKKGKYAYVGTSKFFFSNLAMFNENKETEPLTICITIDNKGLYKAYYPIPEIRQDIIAQCITSVGRITDTHHYLKNLANSTLYSNKKVLERKEKVDNWWKKYVCSCDTCKLSKENYDLNISTYGGQKRSSILLSSIHYLELFNLKSESNLNRLKKVYELSICAIDIEAWTRKLINYNRNFSNIAYVGKKNEIVALQEIALIGYTDMFNLPTHWKYFECQTKTRVKSAREVVGKLIEHIMKRQKTIENMKESLLQPLLNFVKRCRDAHFEFWGKELGFSDDTKKQIELSFNYSLFGKFERKLMRLKNCLYVYTFNGGSYDFVLLHKFIANYLKQTRPGRVPLYIIKRGSRIVRLLIPKSNIKFVDIVDFLGPNSSLNKFAKLTGLKDTKMIFPFSCFDSLEFLLEKNLPTEKERWYNDLKQTYFTDEDIKQAHSDFKKHNCKNVKEYLLLYLQLDCELLGLGVIKYFNSLLDKFEVSPVDCDKTTCASYVGYLMQQFLMNGKRIAQFSPNLLPLYGAEKSAATGGLSLVGRHSADATDEKEDYINSHLSENHNIKGEGIVCWDVTNLYPAAAAHADLPYGTGIFTKVCDEKKDLLMINCFDKHSRRLMNSSESQVVQYLTLVNYPNALKVFSHLHAGPGQICFGSTYKKRVDLCLLLNPGEIKIIQYHDAASHYSSLTSHELNCKFNFNGEQLSYNPLTKKSDDENRRYASWMSYKIKELTITYDIYNECQFFHNKIIKDNVLYNSPKDYLEKFHFSDSVFKPSWLEGEVLSCKTLLDRILNTNECNAGFLVVEKGCREVIEDEVSKLFGFCLQKNTPHYEELGPQAKLLAKEIVEVTVHRREGESEESYNSRLNENVVKYLKNRVDTNFTLTRKSFVHDQCIPIYWFKWLVEKRNILPSVKIIHYIHYEGRNYASNFIFNLLQDRHDLILQGQRESLQCAMYKLTLNSLYGQYLMEQNKYFYHSYSLNKSLRRKGRVNRAININLIGAVTDKNNNYSLMYMLKHPQTTCQIKNLLHVGATILGYSRVIFFNHLYNLLSLLDSRKSELCYIDTDSCFFYVAHSDIKKCVKSGKEEEFSEISKDMFVDPLAKKTQAGKLKMEGYFQSGFWRCPKSYVLQPFPHDKEERIVKNKGISSQVCKQIPNEAFHVSSLKRKADSDIRREEMFFQTLTLNPTCGEQIGITFKRRKMSNPINCKRVMTEVS